MSVRCKGGIAAPGLLAAMCLMFAACFPAMAANTVAPDRQGMQKRLAACAACHGKHGEGNMGRDGGIYPRLAGQPVDYLYHQMLRFKSERRTGIPPVTVMHRLLASLPAPYLRLIARYYHGASAPYPPRAQAPAGQLESGRELVTNGLPQKGIAPCTTCHGDDLGGRSPDTPALAGQYARYLDIQFAHWRQGARHDPLHERIAKALDITEVQAVARYLAWLRPRTGPAPATDQSGGAAGKGAAE